MLEKGKMQPKDPYKKYQAGGISEELRKKKRRGTDNKVIKNDKTRTKDADIWHDENLRDAQKY